MINFDSVANRIFQILKSRGYNLKMYQPDGTVAYDPSYEARKFYVESEGLMVTINREGENSEIKVYISNESDLEKLNPILQSLRQTAVYYGLLYNIRKYGKKLKPKEFSFLAYQTKKEDEMNESLYDQFIGLVSTGFSEKQAIKKLEEQYNISEKNLRNMMKQGLDEAGFLSRFGGTYEYKDYVYHPDLDIEPGEVKKIDHNVTAPDGTYIHVNWSPYNYMKEEDFQRWVDLGTPRFYTNPKTGRNDRLDSNNIGAMWATRQVESVEVFEAKDISNLWGSTKSSYQKVGGPARMVVRHSKPVDEHSFAARSRNINKIFIENQDGERIKFPVNWLQGARAMTRHVSEGGLWGDDIGSYIRNVSEEYKSLKRFNKHVSRSLNEEAADVVETVRSRIKEIAGEMKRIQGPMSYRKFQESFQVNENEDVLNEDNIGAEIERLSGLFEFKDIESIDESLSAVARLTTNKEKVEELKEVKPVEVQVLELLKSGDIEFGPKIDRAATGVKAPRDADRRQNPVLPTKAVKLLYHLRDLASRAKNDAVSVFLSRVVDKIDSQESVSKMEKTLVMKILELEKSGIAEKSLSRFNEWIKDFDGSEILVEEENDVERKNFISNLLQQKFNGDDTEDEEENSGAKDIDRMKKLAGIPKVEEEKTDREKHEGDWECGNCGYTGMGLLDTECSKCGASEEHFINRDDVEEDFSAAPNLGTQDSRKKRALTQFKTDLTTKPGLKQKFRDNPKKVINHYLKRK